MFMNDVNKKEEIRNVAIQDLRKFGIKFRPKKQRLVQDVRIRRRLFKTNLHLLSMQTVTLASGQQLVVPKLVHDLCSFILANVETEGLFRKGGSKSRQNEIKLTLDAGCNLGNEHHEVDVANVLKTFFRELPEPLFPHTHHDSFLRCTLLQEENKLQALLLTCLLLPSDHLNTLAYFMQFLHQVAEFSVLNKMDSYNLAVVIGPTVFPIEEKVAANTTHRVTKICELFKVLIDNASQIGVITEDIIDRIAPSFVPIKSLSEEELVNTKRKKKRRSSSLTRMFSGLRKMVSSKSIDLLSPQPPDLLSTPNITKSTKKRKLEMVGFSNKKKRELLQKLPQSTTLSTPISVHPNPKKITPTKSTSKTSIGTKEKKSQWNLGSKKTKQKQNEDAVSINSKVLLGTKTVLERRWSAVSQAAGFKRNKLRTSCGITPTNNEQMEAPAIIIQPEILILDSCNTIIEGKVVPDPDYVKISRSEYEEIKNRVSAIERRISIELENFSEDSKQDELINDNVIVNVQTAYEKTLVEAEPLSSTTDQLARRLSKELKIRRSCEQKVVRSPSARKIGSLRRRSREFSHHKVQRHQSWHMQNNVVMPRGNLKRGKPNTVHMGLPHPTPLKANDVMLELRTKLEVASLKTPMRAASFHGDGSLSAVENSQRTASSSNISCYTNNMSNRSNTLSEKWTSAESFVTQSKLQNNSANSINGRPSIAKLRNQNAGMVMAKARLFDGLIDSDISTDSRNSSTSISNVKALTKIGSTRNVSAHRIKSLRHEEKRVSPRKKNLKSSKYANTNGSISFQSDIDEKENQLENWNMLEFSDGTEKAALKDCNRIDVSDGHTKIVSPVYATYRNMPLIKKSLSNKSPKRLCRTPLNDNKKTPLKIISSSKRVY